MKARLNVAVVGATGAVGTEMLRVLQERRFPVRRVRLLASARSAGRRVAFNGSLHRVEALEGRSFNGIDVALFSAGASRSLEFAPEAVRRGAVVVDNSSAFRMDQGVPLVVPEVNPHALRRHRGLIANPNCSTIIMVVPLAPLHEAARITRIIVSTYQSVSGAGAKAMAQLYDETRRALRQCRVAGGRWRVDPSLTTRPAPRAAPLPRQIAFNVIPQVGVFLGNRSTTEETKMVHETRKILEEPGLPVSATCVRVPVFLAHSEAIWIETERPLSAGKARRILKRAPGVQVVDAPVDGAYPLPIDAGGRDEVLVGRLRRDPSVPRGLALWVSGDNLRKGAATNAVQIAELLVGCGR
jgi:aspartate-semialdehyde dehydrogenase